VHFRAMVLAMSSWEHASFDLADFRAVQVRPAVREDAAVVAGVYHRGWHAAHAAALPWLAIERPPEAFAAKVPSMLQHCLVAEVCGPGVVGFAAWSGAELGQLFIEPSYTGSGLGAVILDRAEKIIRDSGIDEAFLTCVVGNHRARAFYLQHGWVDRGVEAYQAQTEKGRVPVPVWRLTKRM